jgi:uncharacterized protein DUF4167
LPVTEPLTSSALFNPFLARGGQTQHQAKMRTGSDQPSRGRSRGTRPFQQQRTPQRGQSFDSNGPAVRIRGSAQQIFEQYVTLAREAAAGGDHVAAENLYQHAEHYFRIANASREGNQPAPASVPTTAVDAATSETQQEY